MAHTILSTDDSVNTCDCCGKTGLKFTFVVEKEGGEILHYGSTCVTKHTGRTAARAKLEIQKRADEVRLARDLEHIRSAEEIALRAKMAQAHKLGLLGRAFKDFCAVEREASDRKRAEIFAA